MYRIFGKSYGTACLPAVDRAGRSTWDARRFITNQDGTYTIFGVYIFVLILMLGGIGVDLMRFERDRTNLQYTLDRAVLAAADLDQKLDAESVVHDYFDKAGLAAYVDDVVVTPGVNFRIVSAEASAVMDTHFMHMTGVDTLTVPASGAAEERVPKVEVSLVLGVHAVQRPDGRPAPGRGQLRQPAAQGRGKTKDLRAPRFLTCFVFFLCCGLRGG